MRKKTGAFEWGGTTITIADGCGNGNCRYCYAREMAVRYGRCAKESWSAVKVRLKEIDRDRPLYKNQPVFFQSASDITPSILSECLVVLRKLLDAGNDVLIVSKPHFSCIEVICEALREYQKQITFRFTIGSTDDEVLRFWEPGAPNFLNRYASLCYAKQLGYKTSVSCEPYLDSTPWLTYDALKEEITDSFWVGKLNKFNRRVNLEGVTPEQIQRFVEPLKKLITDESVRGIYNAMKNLPLVRFKDSIREAINGR